MLVLPRRRRTCCGRSRSTATRYNSGDWFNRLDFTYETNNWGVGLPVAEKNEANWPIQGPLLANPDLRPAPSDIERNVDVTREWLAVRESTPLFHLETAADVQDRVSFLNTGSAQIPGLIAMQIADPSDGAVDLDEDHDSVISLFNPTDEPIDFTVAGLVGADVELHDVLADSVDPVVASSSFDPTSGTFAIPARTAAVFVELGPDVTPPVATAAFDLISSPNGKIGWFRVVAECEDDRGVVTTVATINGYSVENGDKVLLITKPHGNRRVTTPWFTIFTAPSFELIVTCTDAAGNTATASAAPEFRRPGGGHRH